MRHLAITTSLLLFVLFAKGCQTPAAQPQKAVEHAVSPTPTAALHADGSKHIGHIVICWLKNPGDKEARQKLIEVSKTFRQIPGVIDVHCGNVIPSPRPVVDSSYDIAVVMTFDGMESLKAYQTDPIHMKATREVLMPLTGRILIYDFIEE
jgi:hypothetical protein